jgi:mannose-6-phosphate isomerase-like protein (cupin superfamily)
MEPAIHRFSDADEIYQAEGCYIRDLCNTDNDDKVSIARARVEPGVTTRWHRLEGIVERYLILAGEGVVEIGDLEPTPVTAGDTVVIPPDCPQRIQNTDERDLLFLAICTPRFDPAAYMDTEPPGS